MTKVSLGMKGFYLIIACVCFGLMACSKHQDPVNDKSAVYACLAQCMKQKNKCIQWCDNGCLECIKSAYETTERDYAEFIHQQKVQGGLIARDLKSYHDPLQCLKITCNCSADYNQCVQACTGTIHKRLQLPLTCC